MNAPLPWQQTAWHTLTDLLAANRLPHALLLTGAPGIGKYRFADALAQEVLCQRRAVSAHACGVCHDCTLKIAGNHPDFYEIKLGEESSSLGIEAIRSLIQSFTLKSHTGGYRVGILAPAEALTVSAANSLLKILEEPPAETLWLLISERPGLLLPTLRSRCRQLKLPKPGYDQARRWLYENHLQDTTQADEALTLAAGAPLTALRLVEKNAPSSYKKLISLIKEMNFGHLSPVAVAQQLGDATLPDTLAQLLFFLDQQLRHQALLPFSEQNMVHSVALFRVRDSLTEAMNRSRTALNPSLVLEDILIRWQAAHVC